MIIGITGGIGSGKSTIAQELARRGFAVYDCDCEAKRIVTENAQVRQAIIALLGPESFIGETYNTAYVALRVFSDASLLAKLNAIVHPAVQADILNKQPDFIESAILYEAGMNYLCDKIVYVDAPEETRIARTIARDYQGDSSPENIDKVRARIASQSTHTGDMILLNDGKSSIAELASKITHLMWKN